MCELDDKVNKAFVQAYESANRVKQETKIFRAVTEDQIEKMISPLKVGQVMFNQESRGSSKSANS